MFDTRVGPPGHGTRWQKVDNELITVSDTEHPEVKVATVNDKVVREDSIALKFGEIVLGLLQSDTGGRPGCHLILDLAMVSDMSSSGIGTLAKIFQAFKTANRTVVLAAVSERITESLRLSRLDRHFGINFAKDAESAKAQLLE